MSDAIQSERAFVVAYGASHAGKSLLWYASELLFAYFLTEACGLPPRQMGLILGASLLLNALADLVGGLSLDRWVRTPGDAGRLQALGAILSAGMFVAFGLAGLVPAPDRFAFALTTIILFRLTYAAMDLPQNALLALATADDGARARLASVRYVFAGVASIVVAGAFAPFLQKASDAVAPAAFALFSTGLAACAAASAVFLWRRLSRDRPPRLTTAASSAAATRRDEPVAPRRWPLFLIMFAISASLSIFGRLEPYFVTYGLTSPLDGGALLVCGAVGALASQPFWSWRAQRRSLISTLRIPP
ncbi:hypothetical protein PMI01_00995, partial [Caulobacter sp. AP07]|uniref:MFS transporter n=1 Tax=Caulobacter sp. AP07 TaxID=1144304 RepID=UPI0002721FE9